MRPLAIALVITAATGFLLVTAAMPDARDVARRLDAATASERDAAARELAALGEAARETLASVAREGPPEARRRARALLASLQPDDDLERRVRRLEARSLLRAALRQEGRLAAGSARDARLSELAAPGAQEVGARAAQRVAQGFLREDEALAVARHPSPVGVQALVAALRADRVLASTVVRAARVLERTPGVLLAERTRSDLRTVMRAVGDPRRRAAAALLLACDPLAARALSRDGDARVRIEAARALGRTGGAGARSLERLARDDDGLVRETALHALRAVPGAPRPTAAHVNAAHHDPAVRAAAATLLSRDAVPASWAVLTRLATDDHARVRAAAERSLAALSRR